MADAQTESIENVDQCLALTGDGERCSRPAQEDGFCFQHDENDPTVDEKNDVSADSMEEAAAELAEVSIDGGEAESAAESEGGVAAESEAEAESEEEGDGETDDEEKASSADEEAESGDSESAKSTDDETGGDESEAVTIEFDEPIDLTAIRDVVQSTGGDLIGRPLDAVVGVSATDDGWRAVVEVVERHAVPDTQDILGQYELLFDEDGTLHRYHRLERFRRGDTREEVDERFER